MTTTEPATTRPPRHPRSRRRSGLRWVGWGLLLLVALLVVAAGLLARDAFAARDALMTAMDEVPAAEDALRAGDVETADAVLADVQPLTATARQSTDGPLWALAAHLPVYGQDVRAFSAAAATVDDLATDVLPALTQALAAVEGDAVRLTGDGVDLAPLQEAAPAMADAGRAFDAIDTRLATVDPTALHAELAEPWGQLLERTDTLRPVVRTADRLTTLGPAMLGADGPRRYLLVALNNAELRAGGGIPGALAVLTADGGKVTLERQASTSDVPPFAEPVLPLDPGVEQLFTDRVGRYVQDTPLTPDYPTTAELTATMWEQAQGETLDGVVATDPVALSYLLEATGPLDVDLGGEPLTIDAGNVVQVLLADAYAALEPGPETDAFFAAVAARVLGAFLGGEADPGVARDALVRGADEHRVLLWSAHAEEQADLAGTVVAGDIDTADRAAGTVGVFFNDGTGGKMGYYLGSDVRLQESVCTDRGRSDTFAVDLSSSAPADAATSLPWYVTGGGVSGVEPGVVRTFVVLYPPRGGQVTDVRLDGAPLAAQPGTVGGREALSALVDLGPGATAALTFTTSAPAGPDVPPVAGTTPGTIDVWTTPTTTQPGLRTVDVTSCG
ncbi:DUF4012 domain-containing protein [Cellulosimicrobium protaetiae]|uniref:DUF4012 domain-containing protein n=1 Tax=Cellulosimicrobium protaetiae TaxID=2587808 RepID=A0A6M5UEU5_9MICO|nr:DUF4012 domain-containing protein [Cellulosimicrobium protaetiae]QJW35753.1 DUF4012 domain-containing protein [Cellulosimicrobium protaetiae]